MKSVEIGTDDPVREYSETEKHRLTENLHRLTTRVHSGAFSQNRISPDLLCELHAVLFDEVRGHAGKHRRAGFGSERLSFGPNRSVAREEVPRKLQKICTDAETGCDRVAQLQPEARALEAVRLAASIHAQFINVHPFEDGNGRTGRALMNVILVRLDYRPVAIEAARQEYYSVLNAFHAKADIEPLVDFLVRLSTADA